MEYNFHFFFLTRRKIEKVLRYSDLQRDSILLNIKFGAYFPIVFELDDCCLFFIFFDKCEVEEIIESNFALGRSSLQLEFVAHIIF
jgi:hypothetical protein